ncbi:MAG: hypothetical protein DK306_001762 [Chloroflexi bacterium]|nr:MAG: hypothetical protein DK306_001762 [Chloroflexota bacterium]
MRRHNRFAFAFLAFALVSLLGLARTQPLDAQGPSASLPPGFFGVDLRVGTNNVGYFGPDADADDALLTLAGAISLAWYFDNTNATWESWDRQRPPALRGLQRFLHGQPYFLIMDRPARLEWDIPVADRPPIATSFNLVDGANNIIWLGPNVPPEVAFADVLEHIQRVWALTGGTWSLWDPAIPRPLRSINDMTLGVPHWVFTDQALNNLLYDPNNLLGYLPVDPAPPASTSPTASRSARPAPPSLPRRRL